MAAATARGRSMVQVLDRARERVAQDGPDPTLADLDDAELERRVRVGASQIAAATCRWLELVAELSLRGVWARQGFASPASWLAWAVSMGASTAREHVRVALSLAEWPALHERFAQGRVSYSKVRAITRYGEPDAEQLLLSYAEHADGAQLERILRGFEASRPIVDERSPFERRDVTMCELDGQEAELTLRAPIEVVLRVRDVLDRHAQIVRDEARAAAVRAAQQDGVEPVPVESIGALRADVLIALAEAAADQLPADVSGADRHTLVWHLQAPADDEAEDEAEEAVVEPLVPTEVATRSGARSRAMSPRALARMACQAGMVAARHDADGRLEALSGRTRRVPARLMRALRARDRRCRYPGCGNTRWVEAHHIHHVADHGKTRMDNLVLLCVRHHHVVHDRGVTIVHDGRGRMRFVLADGTTLPPSPQLPGVGASAEALHPQPGASAEARHPQAARHLQPTHYQHRIDLDACIEALLQELDLLEPPRLEAVAA